MQFTPDYHVVCFYDFAHVFHKQQFSDLHNSFLSALLDSTQSSTNMHNKYLKTLPML